MKKLSICLLLMFATAANAEIHSKSIEYGTEKDKVNLKGHLVWDDRLEGSLPGVILVHEWWGLNDYIKIRAEQLARMGYMVLALDMYGEGKLAAHPKQAGQWSGQVRGNPELAKARFSAAMKLLSAQDRVADDALSAIGYCFGGSVVLDMAIRGLPLKGVASFHGGLSGLSPIKKSIPARIRVFHGNDDGFISAESIVALKEGMAEQKADFEFIGYDGAMHSFTNPGADAVAEKFEIKGLAYNRHADTDSWARLALFLAELYK